MITDAPTFEDMLASLTEQQKAVDEGRACSRVPRHASEDNEPIHLWFELTYASYLVLPRSVLQSMPEGWQRRFVMCLEELDAAFEGSPPMPSYYVKPRQIRGYTRNDKPIYAACDDLYGNYERGRRKVPLKHVPEAEL